VPRSKPPRRLKLPTPRNPRRLRNRLLAGASEFCRYLALIAFAAPIVEPLLGDGAFNLGLAALGAAFALAAYGLSIIFDSRIED
jgi:hypothetical protein